MSVFHGENFKGTEAGTVVSCWNNKRICWLKDIPSPMSTLYFQIDVFSYFKIDEIGKSEVSFLIFVSREISSYYSYINSLQSFLFVGDSFRIPLKDNK